jgi:hypothetical protein
MAASAANIRPVLPAAVIRSAPFFGAVVFVDEEVGLELPELSVVDGVICETTCAELAGVLCKEGKKFFERG